MDRVLEKCGRCSSHVKRAEAVCPFCGERRGDSRVRLAAVAVGVTLAAVACAETPGVTNVPPDSPAGTASAPASTTTVAPKQTASATPTATATSTVTATQPVVPTPTATASATSTATSTATAKPKPTAGPIPGPAPTDIRALYGAPPGEGRERF